MDSVTRSLGVAVVNHCAWGWSGPSLPRGPGLCPDPPLTSPRSSSFQQKNQLATHLTGAFLALFVGHVYFWLQLFLSWRMKSLPQPGAPWIRPLRLLLCSLCTVLLVTSILEGGAWGGSSLGGLLCASVDAPSFLRPVIGQSSESAHGGGGGARCLGCNPTLSTY